MLPSYRPNTSAGVSMRDEDLQMQFELAGAFRPKGHYVYPGEYGAWKHGDTFFNAGVVVTHAALGARCVSRFRRASVHCGYRTVVATPTAREIGRDLAHAHHDPLIRGVHAQSTIDGGHEFLHGFAQYVRGERVVVVDAVADLERTGAVVAACRRYGADVRAVFAVAHRGLTAEQLGVPAFVALITLDQPHYAEHECPMCMACEPVDEEFGMGRDFNLWRAQRLAAVS